MPITGTKNTAIQDVVQRGSSTAREGFVSRQTWDLYQPMRWWRQLTDLNAGSKETPSEGTEQDLNEAEEPRTSTADEANAQNPCNVEEAHVVCGHNQRLQLGGANRHTFFEAFVELAESLSEKGRVFRGKEGGRDVEVCFCVLLESNEGLCHTKVRWCVHYLA